MLVGPRKTIGLPVGAIAVHTLDRVDLPSVGMQSGSRLLRQRTHGLERR